jgi:hypothetical protein
MKKLALFAIMAHFLASDDFLIGKKRHVLKKKNPIDEEANKLKIYKNAGLKCFNIDGKQVWDLNYKNAVRKAGLITK